MQVSPHFQSLVERDLDANYSLFDKFYYTLENMVAADPSVRFYILGALSGLFCLMLTLAWMGAINSDRQEDLADTATFGGALFMAIQVFVTGGYDSTILHVDERLIFLLMVASGVLILSVLIGLITDALTTYMDELTAGTSKVVEDGHTLILGWNEATTRVVCQVAFLRRVFLVQNDTFDRRWFLPGLRARVLPSTPFAASRIVLMNNTIGKEAMEAMLHKAFAERGISPKYTLIGRDVICRKGDPCNNHDLVRMAAYKATSVLIMMTDEDREEFDHSQVKERMIVNSWSYFLVAEAI
jgi:hypothetical protein